MRTIRLLTVSYSIQEGRRVSAQGGVCLGGVCIGRVYTGGVYPGWCLPRVVSASGPGGVQHPSGQTDTCKNITFTNFISGGKYWFIFIRENYQVTKDFLSY